MIASGHKTFSRVKLLFFFFALLAAFSFFFAPQTFACTDAAACNYIGSSDDYSGGACDYSCFGGCSAGESACADGSCSVGGQCPACSSGQTQCSDSSCQSSCNEGCTDSGACNYDSGANVSNGSCEYSSCQSSPGCTDAAACNYNSSATQDDGSCDYTCNVTYGCTDSGACNYNASANSDDGSCEFSSCAGQGGCMDASACNYSGTATYDDGSCDFTSCGNETGCTNPGACNYNASATQDDGSCDFTCQGCTDSSACNYNASATIDDGSCNQALCDGNQIYTCQNGTEVSNPNDCNESANLCASGETLCSDGSCTTGSCPVTYQCSGGTVVYDPAECGACTAGESRCADGTCSASCPATYLCSDGRAVLDPNECGITCSAGNFCCADTLACMPNENMVDCPSSDPNKTGQCNAALTTLSPTEVTVGSPLEGNIGCSYGTGGAVSTSNNPNGDPIYLWSCVGTEGSTSCTAEVEQCPAETPTYCYGACVSGACEPPVEPGPNEGLGGDAGKVILNANLKVTPIIDPGASCVIRWDRDAFGTNQGVFVQSTTTTRCSFSDQSETFLSFDVTDLSAPTSMTHTNVIRDENYVLKCWETNDPSWPIASSTGSCRLNLRPQEFN